VSSKEKCRVRIDSLRRLYEDGAEIFEDAGLKDWSDVATSGGHRMLEETWNRFFPTSSGERIALLTS
jgi:hypothetical protein